MAVLTIAACDVVAKSVTIEGPDIAKIAGTDYKATATGVYPGVGTATFIWYIDVNNDGMFQNAEVLKTTTVVGDAEQRAVSNLWFRPGVSYVNKKVELLVVVGFRDPGSDEYIIHEAEKVVTVRR